MRGKQQIAATWTRRLSRDFNALQLIVITQALEEAVEYAVQQELERVCDQARLYADASHQMMQEPALSREARHYYAGGRNAMAALITDIMRYRRARLRLGNEHDKAETRRP